MGSKIKTVTTGGGSATPLANDFNGWLRQGLNNGSYGATDQTQGIGHTLNTLLGGHSSSPEMESINKVLQMYANGGTGTAGQAGNFDFSQGMGTGGNYTMTGGGFDPSSITGMVSRLPTNVQTSGYDAPEFQAIQQTLGNQSQRDIADIRQRYGISSAGLTNENAYRAQAMPQMAQALTQSALANRGMMQGDIGLGMQGAGMGIQGLLGSGNLGIQNRGQDIGQNQFMSQLQQAMRGMDINQMGLINSNMLGNRGLDQSFMQNYGNLAQGQGGLSLGGQQLGQQGQMGALQQLFQSLNQANQLGTPQAQSQTYMQSSPFMQGLQGLTGLMGGVGSLMGGMGMMGGGGGVGSILSRIFGGGMNPGTFGGGNPMPPMLTGLNGAINNMPNLGGMRSINPNMPMLNPGVM